MRFSKPTRLVCVATMSLMMSSIPNVAAASALEMKLVSTTEVVKELTRQQKEENVKGFLSQDEIKQKLMDYGVSADEASQRIASLSDKELNQLSAQIEQARAGGDILVAILLVVLIIFLIKRI